MADAKLLDLQLINPIKFYQYLLFQLIYSNLKTLILANISIF
ncbi:hypothetical protein FDUTEX481_02885 [Tolypothrix sp. PCC 7601]|nr:hypothetical protein FDUTEX481_02885 [Tolypothrix sp. PCC 7601]